MSTQSFTVGESPRVVVTECAGDLTIVARDGRNVEIELEGRGEVRQSDEGVLIEGTTGDLTIYAPYDTNMVVERVAGDVEASGIAALELRAIRGDVEIRDIRGVVQVSGVKGDLSIEHAGSLHTEGVIRGDAEVEHVAVVVIERVDGDLELEHVDRATIGTIGNDAKISHVAVSLRYGSIGNDLEVEDSTDAMIEGGSVGGNLEASRVRSIAAGDVGCDASVRVSGDITIGSIGGDLDANTVEGAIVVGNVGGDADVHAASEVRIGDVGGDLELAANFGATCAMQVVVGGDASIAIPEDANVSVQATVGGDVSGRQLASFSGGMLSAVYGEGHGQVNLIIGGDLNLDGGREPRVSNAGWRDAGRDFGQFGAEMGRMGAELGRIGADLGRELGKAFSGAGQNRDWEAKIERQAEKIARTVQEQVRKAEVEVQRAGERVEQASTEAGERVRVRMGDREWHFDEERLERIKRQAREAAEGGLASAVEAVERALAGMGAPSTAPRAPEPPAPPVPPMPPTPPTSPVPATGATVKLNTAPTNIPRDIDTERAAILQMIADGRISPDEGELLLEALG